MTFLKYFLKGFHFVFTLMRKYRDVFFAIGFLAPKKTFPDTLNKHKYGIIISARNESLVIGNLIDSIHKQDYGEENLTIFVVADNCTDNTAEIARSMGCVVYERFDKAHARKGYALEYLFEQIEKDYGIRSFDGYVFFDADNLLSKDFITQINKPFDQGSSIVVGYRNTKNFDRNFISAGYGIHFYTSTVMYHRPRLWLGLSTHIAGTGYLVSSEILKDGWHHTCLTEDTEFTLTSVAEGEKIVFCEDAEFFDEQPYELKVMIRQRMRWVKGRLFAFLTNCGKLLSGIKQLGRKGFSCYDMFVYSFPSSTYYGFRSFVCPILKYTFGFFWSLFTAKGITSAAGIDGSASAGVFMAFWIFIEPKIRKWILNIIKNSLVVIREHKKIRCGFFKLIFYLILSPWFDAIGAPLAIFSLFTSSEWKPIKHDEAITIDTLQKQ